MGSKAFPFLLVAGLVLFLGVALPRLIHAHNESVRRDLAHAQRACVIKLQHAPTPADSFRIIQDSRWSAICARILAADTMPRNR